MDLEATAARLRIESKEASNGHAAAKPAMERSIMDVLLGRPGKPLKLFGKNDSIQIRISRDEGVAISSPQFNGGEWLQLPAENGYAVVEAVNQRRRRLGLSKMPHSFEVSLEPGMAHRDWITVKDVPGLRDLRVGDALDAAILDVLPKAKLPRFEEAVALPQGDDGRVRRDGSKIVSKGEGFEIDMRPSRDRADGIARARMGAERGYWNELGGGSVDHYKVFQPTDSVQVAIAPGRVSIHSDVAPPVTFVGEQADLFVMRHNSQTANRGEVLPRPSRFNADVPLVVRANASEFPNLLAMRARAGDIVPGPLFRRQVSLPEAAGHDRASGEAAKRTPINRKPEGAVVHVPAERAYAPDVTLSGPLDMRDGSITGNALIGTQHAVPLPQAPSMLPTEGRLFASNEAIKLAITHDRVTVYRMGAEPLTLLGSQADALVREYNSATVANGKNVLPLPSRYDRQSTSTHRIPHLPSKEALVVEANAAELPSLASWYKRNDALANLSVVNNAVAEHKFDRDLVKLEPDFAVPLPAAKVAELPVANINMVPGGVHIFREDGPGKPGISLMLTGEQADDVVRHLNQASRDRGALELVLPSALKLTPEQNELVTELACQLTYPANGSKETIAKLRPRDQGSLGRAWANLREKPTLIAVDWENPLHQQLMALHEATNARDGIAILSREDSQAIARVEKKLDLTMHPADRRALAIQHLADAGTPVKPLYISPKQLGHVTSNITTAAVVTDLDALRRGDIAAAGLIGVEASRKPLRPVEPPRVVEVVPSDKLPSEEAAKAARGENAAKGVAEEAGFLKKLLGEGGLIRRNKGKTAIIAAGAAAFGALAYRQVNKQKEERSWAERTQNSPSADPTPGL
jgi:hypothetical protein